MNKVIPAALLLPACWWYSVSPAEPPLFVPAPGSPIALDGGPGNVVVADLDGDGKPDLLVACGQGRRLVILAGDGRGGFLESAYSPLSLDSPPGEMALGDLNQDGTLDLAVANHDSYEVTILAGDGRGQFTPMAGSPVRAGTGSRPHTHGLALVDLNGDGTLDLVTVNNEDDNVSVLLGNGRGGFTPARGAPFATGRSPYPPAIGDLNGDGKPDLVTPNTGASSLSVLFGDGSGGLWPAQPALSLGLERPYYVTLGDLNGDKILDLAVAHDDTRHATVWLNDGGGRFKSAGSPVPLADRAWGLALIDFNGDTFADLAAATNTSITILIGDGRGGFSAAPGSPLAAGRGTWRLAVADLNADGKPDLVATSLESNQVCIWLAAG